MTRAERVVWINGRTVPQSEAKISIFDRGFVNGDAAYDAFRTYRHKPFRPELYFDRFFSTLEYLRIEPGVTRERLGEIVAEVLEANLPLIGEHEEYQIILRCSRGQDFHWELPNTGEPTLIVFNAVFRIDAAAYSEGIDLITTQVRRTPRSAVDPRGKTHDRLNHTLADMEAKRTNPAAKCLMLDTDGNVAEGSSYNIGAVIDGVLRTPKDNCLEGRTIRVALELAEKVGMRVSYDDIKPEDLYRASEAFITASSFGMFPVRTIDGRSIGNAVPGPVQERIWGEWDRMVGLNVREQARKYLNSRSTVSAANVPIAVPAR